MLLQTVLHRLLRKNVPSNPPVSEAIVLGTFHDDYEKASVDIWTRIEQLERDVKELQDLVVTLTIRGLEVKA